LCFEIHRSCKVGSFFLNEETNDDFAITDRPGVDVLGQVPSKKNYECVCPNCQRNLAASRFAPHLEKCMGMGRNSSRIASRRIANNQKQGGSDESGQEDENDNDWNYAPDAKRLKRLKKERTTHSPRNRKLSKLRNGRSNNNTHGNDSSSAIIHGSQSSSTISSHPISQLSGLSEPLDISEVPNYDNMTLEERKALLLTSCGVISEHTKKMCTRSVKCSSHTDEQRRLVRQQLLRQSRAHDIEDTHIDIDTYDDADSQTLRESLQWEASSTSSPADSTSTNNSTGAPGSSSSLPSSQTKRPSSSASKGSGGKSKSKKQKSNKSNPSSSSSQGKDASGIGNLFDL